MKKANGVSCALALLASAGSTGSFGQAAAVPAAPAVPVWEKSAGLGFTLTEGNSDTLLVTVSFNAARREEKNEIALGADAAYGENNNVKNNETLRGFAQYNRLFTERVFGYARVDGLHDAIADVDYRFTLSPGAGYYFIKNPSTRLSAEIGPGFVYEKVGLETQGYVTLRVGEKFEHKFNERARLWQSLEALPQVDDWDNYILNAELGVETQITEKLNLRTVLQDTYDHEPAPGRKKNDLKLVTSLVWKF